MAELPSRQPLNEEIASTPESPATELADAIRTRLQQAINGGQSQEAQVDGSAYLNLQEAGDPDKAPGDIYRILEAKPLLGEEPDTAVVVVDHIESVEPVLKVSELPIGDQQREAMAASGFDMGEDGEVLERKREYSITNRHGHSSVRELIEIVAKDVAPVPEGHDGAWRWAQVTRQVPMDAPELAEIAEQVRTLPLKEDVPSSGPIIPRVGK